MREQKHSKGAALRWCGPDAAAAPRMPRPECPPHAPSTAPRTVDVVLAGAQVWIDDARLVGRAHQRDLFGGQWSGPGMFRWTAAE